MKDEKAKYLIIDAKEINKQLYNVKREFTFNIYTKDKVISAKTIFDKYNVPEKFQKIVVKINSPFFIKREVEEYTMGFPFDITAGKIEKENNDKYISASNFPFIYDNQVFKDKIKFKTQLKYSKFDEVIDFLSQIKDSGYLLLYLNSIKDFFDVNLDLDYLYEIWNQEKNPQKVLNLYQRKYPCK